MMPHPTTMTFAWDKDVLRGSQVLLLVLGLAIAVLFSGAFLVDQQAGTPAAVAAEPSAPELDHSASWYSGGSR